MEKSADSFTDSVFLTARDTGLLANGSRDPLGFEVIWVNYASQVIPYLHTQSIGAQNFIVVPVLHWLVDSWLETEMPRTQLDSFEATSRHRRACLLVAETLLVYSVLAQDKPDDHLYGNQRAKKKRARWKRSGEEIEIDPRSNNNLLKGQFQNGHFGRYNRPLVQMGILHKEDADRFQRVTPEWGAIIEEKLLKGDSWFTQLQSELFTIFERILVTEKSYQFQDFAAQEEMVRLRSKIVLQEFRPELTRALQVDNITAPYPPQYYLWNQFSPKTDFNTAGEVFQKAIAAARQANNTAAAATLEKIQELEAMLAHIEAFFDVLWESNVQDLQLNESFEDLQDKSPILRDRSKEIMETNSTAGKRLEDLSEIIQKNPDFRSFRSKLISYHREIMKGRYNPPWVVNGSSDEPLVLNATYSAGLPFDDEGKVQIWRKRDYYLSSLESIYMDYTNA